MTYGKTKLQHVQSGFDVCTYSNTGKHDDPVDIQPLTVQVIAIAECYPQLKSSEGPGTPISGLGDGAFGYQIGIIVDDSGKCIEVQGLTHAELGDHYARDIAMAKIIMAALR
ncbi:MAG: hypothetical protein ACR2KJ_13550 [Jatrophihabitans sp.]